MIRRKKSKEQQKKKKINSIEPTQKRRPSKNQPFSIMILPKAKTQVQKSEIQGIHLSEVGKNGNQRKKKYDRFVFDQ